MCPSSHFHSKFLSTPEEIRGGSQPCACSAMWGWVSRRLGRPCGVGIFTLVPYRGSGLT